MHGAETQAIPTVSHIGIQCESRLMIVSHEAKKKQPYATNE